LLEYGEPTPKQREKIEMLIKHGTTRAAAKAMGISHTTVTDAVGQVRARATKRGFSPAHDMTHAAAPGYFVKGTSTLYDADGNVIIQWNKTQVEEQQKAEQMRAFAMELADEVRGVAKKVKVPKVSSKDRLTCYVMGDPHLGMYAWGEEAGEDFDTDIAAQDLISATTRLAEAAPPSDLAIILNLGDFFHADNQQNVTTRGKNPLDVDTRWPRVMRMGAATMRACIEAALKKHKKVIVRNNIGNHDDHTSHALALILDAFYEKEPRVKVDASPNPFWYYQFGKSLIGSTHGHDVKIQELPGILAQDCPQEWAATEFRYWYLGHFHTQRKHEPSGVGVEFFRTLAAKDAWTNAKGYRAMREMNAIVHHREFGEVERHVASIVRVRSND